MVLDCSSSLLTGKSYISVSDKFVCNDLSQNIEKIPLVNCPVLIIHVSMHLNISPKLLLCIFLETFVYLAAIAANMELVSDSFTYILLNFFVSIVFPLFGGNKAMKHTLHCRL